MKYLNNLIIKGKKIDFPIFCPDATRGVVKSIDSQDMVGTGIEGIIVNTFHLLSQPGMSVIKEMGGIKKFMNWDGLIISDSGGFQVLSLIYQQKSYGKVTDHGVSFIRGSLGGREKYDFTPEKSIQVQFDLGTDILICLDDVPAINAKQEEVENAVRRTVEWAKRCKEEFLKQTQIRKLNKKNRRLLFGVIQGRRQPHLREKCAKALIIIGFDGYGFGGWPVEDGKVNNPILDFTAKLMPDDKPKYALGLGNPQALVDCTKMGYQIFDCVLPTRDARHQRLYVFNKDPDKVDVLNEPNLFGFIFVSREKYTRDNRSISPFCDCYTCQNYSLGYLHHLFKIEEFTAGRLATIHNLRTYSKLIEKLKEAKERL